MFARTTGKNVRLLNEPTNMRMTLRNKKMALKYVKTFDATMPAVD